MSKTPEEIIGDLSILHKLSDDYVSNGLYDKDSILKCMCRKAFEDGFSACFRMCKGIDMSAVQSKMLEYLEARIKETNTYWQKMKDICGE